MTLFWPQAMSLSMRGRVATCSTAAATTSGSQAGPVGEQGSRSPTVSRPRRSEPAGSDRIDAGKSQDEFGDAVGLDARGVDAEAGGVLAVVLDALEKLGDELLAHAGEGIEVSGFGGGLELVDV